MKRDLASLFDLVPLAALKDPPDRDVGGTVYVMRHYCYTVNAVIGNGGWQSEAIWTRQEAERAARALADWLGAEVTR